MPLAIGQRLGPYEITARIGAGGMGEVYRARDSRLKRDVALKVLPEGFASDAGRMVRFEREAQVLASLNHPNIASLYGLEDSGGVRALIMELVEGPTLAERISEGPVALDEALPIARQIAEAVEEAHEKGIIHRDLKPANVKVTPDGKVKVLDFGLAKALEDDPGEADQAHSPTMSLAATRAGMLLGTAGYMSPEQAKGKRVDRRADIWAFGVVLLEMLTGKPVYTGETAAETLAFVMTKDPHLDALPPATPPAIRKLLRRCLEKDPKRRLQAIGEARLMIDEALSGPAEEPQPPSPIPYPPTGRSRAWIAATAASTLALGAVAFIHFREKPPDTPTVRFQISGPEKSTFRNGPPLISPDGRRLAFVATATDGRFMIWVRPLDSLEARPLPGTEDAFFPFWSPDSRFLAFYAAGKLKKVEASGGPPQALCDAPQFTNGTWSRDGVLLIGSFRTGLSRVPSAGGPLSPVTTLDTSRQETGHLYPYFLPDGRHFLYYLRSSVQDHTGIYLGSLDAKADSKDRRRLLGADSNAIYREPDGEGPGHLLFLRDATLMAQSFDTGKLSPSGEPFPAAEAVGATFNSGYFSVSRNGVLLYRGGGAGQDRQLIWFDREGKQVGLAGPPGAYSDLALSPQGTHAAMARIDPQGSNTDIWLLDLARNIPSRFTFHPAIDFTPVWLPDGSRLAFASARDGIPNLYQKIASGAGNEEPLLQSTSPKGALDWSRDGRFFLYGSQEPKTRYDLWVLPLSGDRKPIPFAQTEFDETQGQFSPDGRWIAYDSNESGRPQVYVQPFPPSGGKWQISSEGGIMPRWRADGKELFYISTDSKMMAAGIRTTPGFDASVPKQLFQSRIWGASTTVFRYSPSADGRRFLMISQLQETASAPITAVLNWKPAR